MAAARIAQCARCSTPEETPFGQPATDVTAPAAGVSGTLAATDMAASSSSGAAGGTFQALRGVGRRDLSSDEDGVHRTDVARRKTRDNSTDHLRRGPGTFGSGLVQSTVCSPGIRSNSRVL